MLARQALYHLHSRPPAVFALVIFEIGSRFFPRLVWTTSLLFMLAAVAG
jgi:hypothetical protein